MIIFQKEKYACIKCIRGHRSSTCVHTARMLVKVRTRGRPFMKDVRDAIVVDNIDRAGGCRCTEPHEHPEVENETNDDEGSKTNYTCKGMNKQPILFVRAKKMTKARIVGGELKELNKDEIQLHLKEQEEANGGEHPRQQKIKLENGETPHFPTELSLSQFLTKPVPQFGDDINSQHNATLLQPEQEIQAQIISENSNQEDDSEIQTAIGLSAEEERNIYLTKRGVYLSTECTCSAATCACSNCLIHRTEEELNKYIEQSEIPLTNLMKKHSESNSPAIEEIRATNVCKCKPEECSCEGCSLHSTVIIPFQRIIMNGLLNTQFTKKTLIKYKKKLISYKYWWDFLTVYVPYFPDEHLEGLDIVEFFETIITNYHDVLPDSVEGELKLKNSNHSTKFICESMNKTPPKSFQPIKGNDINFTYANFESIDENSIFI